MWLTKQNAKDFLGKTLDAERRMGHYYPLKVFMFPDGSYGVEDRAGVCMPVADEKDKFNHIYFDKVVSE